ncbi:O-antigen ligase family protein [Cohnella suwonensis]|uniref:O-antigen ligase family protein n=1 Tax=Cohnella suwonensis TaxID=696072 RepID=A0ABW0LV98_9BACL
MAIKSVISKAPAIVAAFMAAALGWSAYRYGMFFSADFYRMEIAISAAATLYAIWLAKTANEKDGGSAWRAWLPFGLAVLFALELALGPASVLGTEDAALRWFAYGCWTLLVSGIVRAGRSGKEAVQLAIQATGAWLLAGGWAGWYGGITFTDIVLRFDDAELSATGARLAGFLQYPNAYGAVMAAFLLMQLQCWASGGRLRRLAAATAVPYGGALLLTESRGAVAAFAIGAVLAWLLQPGKEGKARLLAAGGIAAAGAGIATRLSWQWMNAAGEDGQSALRSAGESAAPWLAIVCAIAGAAALLALDKRGAVRLPWAWLAACAGLAVAGWISFAGAGDRISGHYGTVSSRKLFYEDGWRMFLDRPILGNGGGSWRAMFGLYQGQPYVGGEVHSGYLDLLLDVGLIGFAWLAFMLGAYLLDVWRFNRTALAPAVVLLVHAATDFDWSYAFVWLLLLSWFILHGAPAGETAGRSEEPRRGQAARRIPAWTRRALAALLAVAAATGAWAAWRSDAAMERAAAGMAVASAAREAKLRAALEANPAMTRIRLALAPLLPLRERAAVLEAGLRYEPYAPRLRFMLGDAYAELGNVAQAAARLREATRLERFGREGQTAAVATLARLAQARRDAGDEAGARAAAEAAVSQFGRYRELDRQVAATAHPANGKQFGLTVSAKMNAAKSLLLLSRDEEGKELLREVIREGDADWREEARELLGDEPAG